MAKGKAAKSATGAAMSKYDVEVEKRLKALEAEAHPKCDHGTADAPVGDLGLIEHRLNIIEGRLDQVAGLDEIIQRLDLIEAVLARQPKMNYDKNKATIAHELAVPTQQE